MRPENLYLPNSLKSPFGLESDHGDSTEEIKRFLRLGIDGFFTDAPDYGRRAIKEMQEEEHHIETVLLNLDDEATA
jgi:glycerophosphoryl diester phosphodiesterase